MHHAISATRLDPALPFRRGTALVVVLVVIALLSLGAYTFSELMITEYHASDAYGRQLQARAWAQSGPEYVASLLTPDGGGWNADLYNNPDLFHVPLDQGGGFTIVAPVEDATVSGQQQLATGAGLRFGLMDEGGKLNLNVLANFDPAQGVGRNMLLPLPHMTEELADRILDWIDADTAPREFGSEAEGDSVVPQRNGPIDTLEELLLITGITPDLLYGEDANRNGLLDPNENDGDLSLPLDNADGVLDLGWSAYLTLYSRERNLRHTAEMYGQPRINVNQTLLTDLYDALEEELGSTVATFVTAYRMNGPVTSTTSTSSSSTSSSPASSSSSTSVSTAQNPLNGMSSSGNSGGSRGTTTTGNTATDAAISSLSSALANGIAGATGTVSRGGMDLSQGGSVQIKSLYELVGSEVQATINGQSTTLTSPWSGDPGSLQQHLPLLLDTLSVTDTTIISGRVNINQARLEVLQGIPNMPPDVPAAIIATRRNWTASGGASTDRFQTAGWLVIEGLVDLPTMRTLDGFLTAGGDVFRMQVIGHSDRGGPMARLEAIVDATQAVPRIVLERDLAELGPGFRPGSLPSFTGSPAP